MEPAQCACQNEIEKTVNETSPASAVFSLAAHDKRYHNINLCNSRAWNQGIGRAHIFLNTDSKFSPERSTANILGNTCVCRNESCKESGG